MDEDQEAPMSTWDWFWTLLLLNIPVVGLILFIVWACGVGNVNRVTFCRAILLLVVVIIALGVILAVTVAPSLMSAFKR